MIYNLSCIALFLLCSCTMTFQNVNNQGKNSDVVHDEITNQPDVTSTIPVGK